MRKQQNEAAGISTIYSCKLNVFTGTEELDLWLALL